MSGDFTSYCAGLAKHADSELTNSQDTAGRGYIALGGKQSLADDNPGTAVFYDNGAKVGLTEDKLSYIVILKPTDGKIRYYFAACWEQEPGGIKTKKEFVQYLQSIQRQLNNPVLVQVEILNNIKKG